MPSITPASQSPGLYSAAIDAVSGVSSSSEYTAPVAANFGRMNGVMLTTSGVAPPLIAASSLLWVCSKSGMSTHLIVVPGLSCS